MALPWTFERAPGGILLLRCEALGRVPGLAHAFSTRIAEETRDFDLGPAVAPGREVADRRAAFLRAAGLSGAIPFVLRQVHGNRVVLAGLEPAGSGTEAPEGDAALWVAGDGPVRVPCVRTADCVPLLLADRSGRAAAAVHAGWRGTAAGVAGRAVEALRRALASPAADLVAALGPAIGRCCYEVGPDVERKVLGASGLVPVPGIGPARRLDLQEANRRQLERAGVPAGGIHAAPWCTRCRSDLFFSYRRDGPAAGRLMAVIGPRS